MTKNLFKKCMEFDWNFQSGSGMLKKIPPSLWGGYFLELHNSLLVKKSFIQFLDCIVSSCSRKEVFISSV